MIEIINDLSVEFGNSLKETIKLITSSGFKKDLKHDENNFIFIKKK